MHRRALALALATATLGLTAASAGCGFQPVYSQAGRGIGPVQVALIDGRTGYFVQQELVRKAALERGNTPARSLEVELENSFTPTNQREDGFFNRTQMTVTASWKLLGSVETPDGQGRVSVTVAYDSQTQAFADVTLQADAEERAAVLLADRIWADVASKSRPPGAAVASGR